MLLVIKVLKREIGATIGGTNTSFDCFWLHLNTNLRIAISLIMYYMKAFESN
jgi:hypothetical protein